VTPSVTAPGVTNLSDATVCYRILWRFFSH